MKKARLLFILYDRPNYPGGPIINYLRLLPALVERGYDVHVLVLYHADYPNARALQKSGVQVHAAPFIADSRQAVRWILDQTEKNQPDIFIPDVSTPGCFAGKWIKSFGIPVINSHRSDDKNNWGKAIYFSDPKYGFESSAIFCVSNHLLRQLEQKVENLGLLTAVIPSGVPIPQYYSRQEDPVSIVYVGRLIQRQKRVLDTVRVFIELASKFARITFTLIGDGPERKACEEAVARSGYAARFRFTGVLKDDTYKKELARHDIVVLLSEYEGVPGSLMDGMASGLIPVCYHYSGVEELVIDQQTGLLVNDRTDSVIHAVSTLISDPVLRKQMSFSARKHILEHFSLESTLNKWESLITTLMEKYNAQKTMFVAPQAIDLPPMNDLLQEHILQKEPAIFQRMYSIFRVKVKSFLLQRFVGPKRASFDNFINIPFSRLNLDSYFMRTSILKAFGWAMPNIQGRLLDAGCGKMPYKGYVLENSAVHEYVGLDIETALVYDEKIKPDYTWDGKIMPFENNDFDSCIAIEVLEHCPEPDVFLAEVYRVLKPGCVFFFTVPYLWNLHEVPHDEYRYTPFALERHLRNSGFREIEIKATGGWYASLAQMLGLWVKRAPMSARRRVFLSWFLKPIIGLLIKKDKEFIITFSESQMITSLYGLAKK